MPAERPRAVLVKVGAVSTALAPEEIRSLRGQRTRDAFARELGVTPVTVYRWELPSDAPQARRPRGEVLRRLLKMAAEDSRSNALPVAEVAVAGVLDASDEAKVLPVLDLIFAARFDEAERLLMRMWMGSELKSPAGRCLAGAAMAQLRLIGFFDARGAFVALEPALREADAGTLPPLVEVHVRVAASLLFSSFDGQLFHVGRVNEQIQRAEPLLRSLDGTDLQFLLWVGLAASALQAGGREWGISALVRLQGLADEVRTCVARLVAAEMRGHEAFFIGRSEEGIQRMLAVARDAERAGYASGAARCLSLSAIYMAESLYEPEPILEVARSARMLHQRAHLSVGIHSLFGAQPEAEALIRLGRFSEAEGVLREALEDSSRVSWAPQMLKGSVVQLALLRGEHDLIPLLTQRLRAFGTRAQRALADVLDCARDVWRGTGSLELLEAADAALLSFEEERQSKGDLLSLYSLEVRVRRAAPASLRELRRLLEAELAAALHPMWGAQLRRLLGICAFREACFSEASGLLEAALAMFRMAGSRPDVAVTELWLARLLSKLGDKDAAEERVCRERQCVELGLVVPEEVLVVEAPPVAQQRLVAREELWAVPLERLAARGLNPRLLLRELVAVLRQFLPGHPLRLEVLGEDGRWVGLIDSEAEGRARVFEWFELTQGPRTCYRLGVGAPLPEVAPSFIRALVSIANLSLENAHLRGAGRPTRSLEGEKVVVLPEVIAVSPPMRRLREELARLSDSSATVLLMGESGVGKEVIARALHQSSRRRGGPYVTFNCAGVPQGLFEAQLFGYRRGAFTGATADSSGVVRAADGGTLFLDEVGELPLELQPKLLRLIENREVLPLGEAKQQRVNVRLVAATNRDLAARVRDGAFREDLYYRLNVVPLRIPPLRDRLEDIAPLARHFLRQLVPHEAVVPELSSDALSLLHEHPWPGNVRELKNAIERVLAFSPMPALITARQLGRLSP